MNSPAPIALFVYKRPDHTRKTIEALLRNELAAESKLYIFSDAPKNEQDQAKVNEVRELARAVKGFNEIEIVEQEENQGLANSVIAGVTKVMHQHGKAIVLEDDIVTAPGFLSYMNAALEFYENDKNIFSVSGYSPEIRIPGNYGHQVFITQRASSWGWAAWKDRWDKADWNVSDYDNFIKNRNAVKAFNREGEDLTTMLKAQHKGLIDSWAVRWSYTHFKNNAYCLYPVKSKAKNIGIDNSGTHSKRTNKFDVEIDTGENKDFNFPKRLGRNEQIAEQIAGLYKPSLLRKAINYVKLDILR